MPLGGDALRHRRAHRPSWHGLRSLRATDRRQGQHVEPCLAAHLALAGETLKPNAPHVSQSFIHAMDVARGVRLVLTTPNLEHDTFNLAGEPVPQERMIKAIVAAVPGTEVEWVADETHANIPLSPESGQIAYDNRRIWRETGFQPLYRIETGIEQYVEWLKEEG